MKVEQPWLLALQCHLFLLSDKRPASSFLSGLRQSRWILGDVSGDSLSWTTHSGTFRFSGKSMNNGKCFLVGPLKDDPPHPGPAHCHFLPKVQNSPPPTACLLENPFAPFLLDSVYPGSRGLRPHCKGGPPRRTCFRGACCRDSGLSRCAGAPAQGGPGACSRAPAAQEPGPSSASLNSLEV